MSKERRAFARIQLDLPASMALYQMEIYHTGSIVDLSMGGCFIPLCEEVPVNEECHITLTTGEGLEATTIELKGDVVRCTPKVVGIQFKDKSEMAETVLKEIIERKQGLTY